MNKSLYDKDWNTNEWIRERNRQLKEKQNNEENFKLEKRKAEALERIADKQLDVRTTETNFVHYPIFPFWFIF